MAIPVSSSPGAVSQGGSGPPKTRYDGYAQYVAEINLAATVGTVSQIADPLTASAYNQTVVEAPEQITAYRTSLADQINDQSNGPAFEDLSERIADVILETTAQGASTLEVHIIDPYWVIPMSGMIQVDTTGYLWPPIEVNFPQDTNCWWRLVQYAPTWGATTEANLVLTFEDKIANQLREMSAAVGGVQQGSPNQTLGGFIKQLVDSTNHTFKTDIRLVELISPKDPNYTLPVTNIPGSAESKLNSTKVSKGPTPAQLFQIERAQNVLYGKVPTSGVLSIRQTEARLAKIESNGYIPGLGTSNANGAGVGSQG